MNENLYQLLADLNAEAPKVRATFNDLFDSNLDTVPIPFFGDVLSAKVITVGLNPSDGEIRGRGWHQPISPATIYERLVHYFNNPQFRSHPWFDAWERSLGEIGVSYSDGTAAHVDLCPWATRPMSNLPDHDRFALLLSQSLPWFWRCMQVVTNLRLILMAGAVTKKYYLNEFLQKRKVLMVMNWLERSRVAVRLSLGIINSSYLANYSLRSFAVYRRVLGLPLCFLCVSAKIGIVWQSSWCRLSRRPTSGWSGPPISEPPKR
jgi:hypothetical protein